MKNTKSRLNRVVQEDISEIIKTCDYETKLQNKSILITGSNGLIATYLIILLLEINECYDTNIKVYALTRSVEKTKKRFKGYLNKENFLIVDQDVCERVRICERVDYIFHAAGSASAYAIKNNPVDIIKANTIGTINVLDYAVEKNVEKVIFPSTREIYGEIKGCSSIGENDMGMLDPLNSRNCYPESKRMAEAVLESYYQQYGLKYSVLRIAHTYGPMMNLTNDGRVMADFIEAVVNKHDIIMNSDGTAVRSFCYITDTIRGIMDVILKGVDGEAYNLANEREPYEIREIAEKLIQMFPDRNCNLKFAKPNENIRKGYVGYKITRLETNKIESIGWKPKVDLESGMRRTVEYFIEDSLDGDIK